MSRNRRANKKTKVIFAREQDVLDPEKGDAIINQILDQLEVDGCEFAPEDESQAAARAQAFIDEAIEFARRGQSTDALACAEKALAACCSFKGKSESLTRLSALALANKGAALGNLNRFPEALECYDAAIAIETTVAGGDDTQRKRDRAIVVMNRGWALVNLGQRREREALACYQQALDNFRLLVQDGHTHVEPDVALVLYNTGDALFRAGRFQDAVTRFDEALSIYERLIDEGRDDLEADLAYTLGAKADTLQQLGLSEQGLKLADEAIAIFRPLASESGNPKLAKDLARAINLRGALLNRLGRLAEAQASIREAVALRGD